MEDYIIEQQDYINDLCDENGFNVFFDEDTLSGVIEKDGKEVDVQFEIDGDIVTANGVEIYEFFDSFDEGIDDLEESVSLLKNAGYKVINEMTEETDVRKIDTGLKTQLDADIIDAVFGQLSDGMWENSRAMNGYWPFISVKKEGDKVYILVSEKFGNYTGYRNKLREMSDEKIKTWVANHIKAVIKEEGLAWKRDNREETDYLSTDWKSSKQSATVSDCYFVYEVLKGRNATRHPEYQRESKVFPIKKKVELLKEALGNKSYYKKKQQQLADEIAQDKDVTVVLDKFGEHNIVLKSTGKLITCFEVSPNGIYFVAADGNRQFPKYETALRFIKEKIAEEKEISEFTESTMDEALNHPDGPATSRQLWALFCMTKKDYRGKGLTKQQASDLIGELKSGKKIEDAGVEKPVKNQKEDENALVKVGDIYHRHWGYNMSINTYYKVLMVRGKKATVVELGKKVISGSLQQGKVVPDEKNRETKTTIALIKPDGSLRIRFMGDGNYDTYYKWDGQPDYEDHMD